MRLAAAAALAIAVLAGASSSTMAAPPTVAVTAPLAGATVSGAIRLGAFAYDDGGVVQVVYYVDGIEVAEDSTAPDWGETWETWGVANGAHTIVATARDHAGNVTASVGVRFTVANGGDPVQVPPPPQPAGAPRIAVAGDIASEGDGDEITAGLLDSLNPDLVLTTGDNAYPDATLDEFRTYYEPTWGRYKRITRPVPGNHDYHQAGASGYFSYFGAFAGDPRRGYYSYDLGTWHLIALNSEVPVGEGSAQLTWLKQDLAASSATCTLAYWHKPLFTGGSHTDDVTYRPLWEALYDADAEVVLNGHDHNYQRMWKMTPLGVHDSMRGIREFIVGTGGRSYYSYRDDSRRIAGNATAFGVLELTLNDGSYDWRFVPEPGSSYVDAGSQVCH